MSSKQQKFGRVVETINFVFSNYYENYSHFAMQILEPRIVVLSTMYTIKGYDTDDLAQELRLHLWNKLQKYNPEMAKIQTWGERVLRNKIIDINRCTKKDSINHTNCSIDELIENNLI